MPLLQGIKAIVMPMLPRRCKDVIIDRMVRRMPALPFGFPFGATGYQAPDTNDPWISSPGHA